MSRATGAQPDHLLSSLAGDRRFGVAVGILFFVLAMSGSAYVAVPVPWSVVPMTLQPAVVLVAGAVLGPWAGAAAMTAYLALGASGIPVFSGGHAGLPWLVGPTGGYLMAFPVAALVVGWIAGSSVHPIRLVAGFLAGLGVIYLGGLTQLAVLTGQGLPSLLAVGVVPFVVGDLVKVLLALIVVRSYRTWSLGRR